MLRHLTDYAEWYIARFPSPRWAVREYLKRCVDLWRKEYGDEVADKARGFIADRLKAKKKD